MWKQIYLKKYGDKVTEENLKEIRLRKRDIEREKSYNLSEKESNDLSLSLEKFEIDKSKEN